MFTGYKVVIYRVLQLTFSLSQNLIILRAGFKKITGPEFHSAAITKGQKLFGHVFNVGETKICIFSLLSWGSGISCFDRWIYLSLRSLRLGDSVFRLRIAKVDLPCLARGHKPKKVVKVRNSPNRSALHTIFEPYSHIFKQD